METMHGYAIKPGGKKVLKMSLGSIPIVSSLPSRFVHRILTKKWPISPFDSKNGYPTPIDIQL